MPVEVLPEVVGTLSLGPTGVPSLNRNKTRGPPHTLGNGVSLACPRSAGQRQVRSFHTSSQI